MEYVHGRFEPRLEIAQHPPRKWFMAGAHNSDHFTFKIVLRTRFLQRGVQGMLPLRVQLLYDNDYPVDDQGIAQFLEKPRLLLELGAVTVRVRILEASTWPKHGNKHFYFRVSTPAMVAGEKVTQCCTKAFQVLSKSIEHLKYELNQLGDSAGTTVDDVRAKYGVDRRGNVGNRVVSSDMTIQLTRSDQRKALLRARIDNHGAAHRKSRSLPPKSEQLCLFKMFNNFKQDRIEYFKSRQPPKEVDQGDGGASAPRQSLARSLHKTRSGLSSLRALLPVVRDDEKVEPGAPSTVDNGLWKRNLKMYKKPAELALAKFYIEDSRYELANELCERTLKIQAAAMGDRHPVCALTLLTWGRSNREQGLTEAALKQERQALEIRLENYHTISNPLCMEALDAVCATLSRRRDFAAAQQLCFGTMVRFLSELGPGHETVMELHVRAEGFRLRYERHEMAAEDAPARRRYEYEHMQAEDHRARERNVARLNAILHAGGSLLGIKFLRMYALSETGTSELDFWLAVQDFRRLAKGSVEFEVEVRRIFKEFIAPVQVLTMLTADERTAYRLRLAGGAKQAPDPTMYDALQSRVLRAIANGWFLRFEGSPEHANFQEALAMQEEGFFQEGDSATGVDFDSNGGTPLTGSSSADTSGFVSPKPERMSPRPGRGGGGGGGGGGKEREKRWSRLTLDDFAAGNVYNQGDDDDE